MQSTTLPLAALTTLLALLASFYTTESAAQTGCTDDLACNFDALANLPDGSCVYESNPNFDLTDTTVDWIYTGALGCAGDTTFHLQLHFFANHFGSVEQDPSVTFSWSQCDGLLTIRDLVAGTDIELTYGGETFWAFLDDGNGGTNCLLLNPHGCTIANAQNFSPQALTDDGSCVVMGCNVPTACNYDSEVTDNDGSCISDSGPGVDFSDPLITWITTLTVGCAGDPSTEENTTFLPNHTGMYGESGTVDFTWAQCDGLLNLQNTGAEGVTILQLTEGDFWAMANDGQGGVNCMLVQAHGCMNPAATNFSSQAQVDNGSCIIMGCTDDIACNYAPTATDNDGSCTYFNLPQADLMDPLLDWVFRVYLGPNTCTGEPTIEWHLTFYANQSAAIVDEPASGFNWSQCGGLVAMSGLLPGGSLALEILNGEYWAPAEGGVSDGCAQLTPYGCTDPSSPMFSAAAMMDNGTCADLPPLVGDIDGDGMVGVTDVMLLLSNFGATQ